LKNFRNICQTDEQILADEELNILMGDLEFVRYQSKSPLIKHYRVNYIERKEDGK